MASPGLQRSRFSGCARFCQCSERSGAMACRNKPWRQFIHPSCGKKPGFHAHLHLQHTVSFAFPSREPRANQDGNRERVHARPCSQDVLSHLGTFSHRALKALFLSSLGCEISPVICRAVSLPACCWPKLSTGVVLLLLSSTAGSFCTTAQDTKISQELDAGDFGSTLPQNVLTALQGKPVELGT